MHYSITNSMEKHQAARLFLGHGLVHEFMKRRICAGVQKLFVGRKYQRLFWLFRLMGNKETWFRPWKIRQPFSIWRFSYGLYDIQYPAGMPALAKEVKTGLHARVWTINGDGPWRMVGYYDTVPKANIPVVQLSSIIIKIRSNITKWQRTC
jgi:hypothetical protein